MATVPPTASCRRCCDRVGAARGRPPIADLRRSIEEKPPMTFPVPPTRRMSRLALLAGLALAVAAPSALAQQAPTKPGLDRHGMPEKFSGDRIKELWFDGQPFTAVGPDGTAYRMVFMPDGKAARTQVGVKKPKPVNGFWRVIAEGYCSRWAGSNREKCFNVRKSEDGTKTVVRFGQQIAATWERP